MPTELHSHTQDPRLETLSGLPQDVQRFLEFLSFLYTPQTKKLALSSYDTFLSRLGESGTNLDWWFSRLRELGLLEITGGRYRVTPGLVEDVSARAAAAGRAGDVCSYLRKTHIAREMGYLVRARWALYQGDEVTFQRVVEERRVIGHRTDDYDIFDAIIDGCTTESPIAVWPTDIATILVRGALTRSINQARPREPFWKWWREHILNPRDADGLHQLFLRDESGIPETSHLVALRGILAGDLSALPSLKDRVRRGKGGLFPFASQEFVYLVACFADGDIDCVKERLANGSAVLRDQMNWYLKIRTGETCALDRDLAQLNRDPSCPPMMKFFLFLLFYWAGFSEQLEVEEIAALSLSYEQAGYPVPARELHSLARHLAGEGGGLTPFLNLLKPQEQWRTRLHQLQTWATHREPEKEKIDIPEQRVVWILDPDTHHLSSKIQKIGKRGEWTAGRAVGFSDLRYEARDILTEQDVKILMAWNESNLRYQRSSPRYGSRWLDQSMFEALIEHPLLFSKNGEPLQLIKVAPCLLVEEEGGNLKLSLQPRAGGFHDFSFRRLDDNTYGIALFERKHLELMQIIEESGLLLPKSESRSIQALLGQAAELGFSVESCLRAEEGVESERHIPRLALRLSPFGRGLSLEVVVKPLGSLTFQPGQGPSFLLDKRDGQPLQLERDLPGEMSLYRKLRGLVPQLKNYRADFLHPGECLELLDTLRRLPEESYTLQWPRGKRFQHNQEVNWSHLSLSIRGGKEWFTLDTQLELDGHEHLQLFQLMELHRSQGTRFIALDEERYLTLSQSLLRKLQALESAAVKQKNGSYTLHPLTASVLLESDELKSEDSAWQRTQERLASAKTLNPALPKGLKAELRPYQKRGFEWLARSAEWGVGVCLADDMGLGKTVQILSLILRRAGQGPTLVVAPTSVCSNWRDEAQKFAPGLNPIEFREADRKEVVESAGPGDVVICSYGILVSSLDLLKKVRWTNLVLDESQAIKNHTTQRFKAAISLPADFRIAATGTPVENNMSELWSLFRFLNPGLLGAQRSFLARFGSDPTRRSALKNLIAPFLLRRLKEDVLSDLPPKTDITLKVELSREERLFYESVRLNAVERIEQSGEPALIGILAELSRLRRVCCHPRLIDPATDVPSSKLERFRELITDLREAGHRTLVFSQFVDYLTIIRREVEELGLSYRYLDGSTPPKERKRAVKEFQEGHGDLFLISLKAGGTGLNLTQANYVIHMDPWWNPATEDQASDRAHRIGQDKPVTVYRLIGAGTVEEKILRLHDEKRELVDSLLSGSDRAAKLSAEELLELLRQSAVTV